MRRASPFEAWTSSYHEAGTTISDAVAVLEPRPLLDHCELNGDPVAVSDAGRTLRDGDVLTVSPRPGAGVALAPLAFITTAAAAVYGLRMLQQSMVPPAPDDDPDRQRSGRRAASGLANAARPYEGIGQVLGRVRMYPDQAAASYRTVEGGKLVQYVLLTCGYGPVEFDDLRFGLDRVLPIGTTITYTGRIAADSTLWKNTEFEFRQGTPTDAAITLYAKNVVQQNPSVRLTQPKGWVRRVTVDECIGFTVIVGCPQGLYFVDSKGKYQNATVRVQGRYRLQGTAPWITIPLLRLRAKTRDPFYGQRTVSGLTAGVYEIELRRVTAPPAAGVSDQTVWSSIVVNRSGPAVVEPGLSFIAARIQLTNQKNDTDDLNLVATTVAKDWDKGTMTWIERATDNPASLYRHVLQGEATGKPVDDARIDLAELADWHERNEALGFTFGRALQSRRRSVWQMLKLVAASGRARATQVGSRFTVVQELPLEGEPVLHVTPRNSWGFTSSVQHPDVPNALRVGFTDPDQNWLDTDRVVPNTGFTETTAEDVSRLDVEGCTSAGGAWRIGRYSLAAMRLRNETWTVTMDAEYINAVPGSWVKITHDVPGFGVISGKIVGITLGGSDVVAVTTDVECPTVGGSFYLLRYRSTSTGKSVAEDVAFVSTSQSPTGLRSFITFASPISAPTPLPAIGDLFMFGEIVSGEDTEAIDAKVVRIKPADEYSATIVLQPAAPELLDDDDTTPPDLDENVNINSATSTLSPPPVSSVGPTNGGSGG